METRPWWPAGRNVPGAIANAASMACLTAGLLGIQAKAIADGDKITAVDRAMIWCFLVLLALAVVSSTASIRVLYRHPAWILPPAKPLSPGRARVGWWVGSTLAAAGWLGLVPVALGVGGNIGWLLQGGCALVAFFVFTVLARGTDQRLPRAANAPPTIT